MDADPARSAIERLFREGQGELAMQRAEQAVAARPDSAGMRFLHGVMLSESRREPEAERVFERMIQDFPELPEPYNNLAVLRAAKGQWEQARELLEAALRNDPGYHTAQLNLGDVLVQLALRAYQAAATRGSEDAALARRIRMARDLAASNALP